MSPCNQLEYFPLVVSQTNYYFSVQKINNQKYYNQWESISGKLMSSVLVNFIYSVAEKCGFNHLGVFLIILECFFTDNAKIKGNYVNADKHPYKVVSGHL